MRLYIADINCVKPDDINKISPERRKKAERYRFEDDKKRCILGGLLTRRFLGDTGIYLNKSGKPMAENGVCFNISHSGDYVLFAVDDKPIGCDIEKPKVVPYERMGKVVFCENEMDKIKNSPDKQGEFFALWTKKEALLKCMGEGFHRPAKSVDVSGEEFSENGVTYRLKTYVFADYVISVCTEGEDFAEDIEFIEP